MKRLYLASASPARRKLLTIFGLEFRVFPSKVRERRKKGSLSYAALAKGNAFKKAQDIAFRVKKGVVVAADTIVVQGREVFVKPANLKEARTMLKKLSSAPHWLYTGIAVIDSERKRAVMDCEKTKVYMDKLSDRDIDSYFSLVSPLDKAGGFDIQGKGAFFIRRIEGCFYNVVGLPLRKLYLLLKKAGINPLSAPGSRLKTLLSLFFTASNLALSLFLGGCSSEYNIVTGKEEMYYYSTDKEVQMGQSIARQVEKEYKLAVDPLMQKRVEDIGQKIARICDRKEIDYHFKVIDDEEVNAFALPGGFIYVNKGLVEKAKSDDELAGVLGHEVGHVVARHSIKKLQAITGYSIIRLLATAVPQSGEVGNAADLAFTEIMLGYSRDDELLADELSSRYAKLAGYNPRAMIDFLQTLQEINRNKPLRPKSYFKTHPYIPDRIRVVKQEIGENIGFSDYINIEEVKDR